MNSEIKKLIVIKDLNLSHKLKLKPLIFQTKIYIFYLTEFAVLNYLRSKKLVCKDIEIRKSEFVAKAHCTIPF